MYVLEYLYIMYTDKLFIVKLNSQKNDMTLITDTSMTIYI